ncbi:MAG: hypothetical protein MUP85_01340 [Candidatus Lokiarchaeota archaeon]|nr:hypothetical protein [Candidatus Lokiarchaeota archaeon]
MTTTPATKRKSTETKIEELPNNPFVFEVLQLLNKQRTSAKKVEVLQTYAHDSLKAIFIWNFDDNVVSMLPEGEVPYSTVSDDLVKTGSVTKMIEKEVEKMEAYDTKSVSYTEKIRSGHTTLRSEYTKLINFVRSASGVPGNNTLNPLRRENMFIQMLEGLHPLDAEIMCLVKDKKLQTRYKITKDIVSEAYSDIKWENR